MKILVLCANGIATSILMKEVIKKAFEELNYKGELEICLLYTSPSPRD